MERHFSSALRTRYRDRMVTIGRTANLTERLHDRGPCLARNMCARGCPYGGYFSSNAATLPAAAATGNMTLLADSIVAEVLFDEQRGRAAGVRVIDRLTKDVREYYGRLIFLNASTIATAALLLQSRSRRFPQGLGNSSGQVGHNLMDHVTGAGISGEFDGLADKYYSGRRPTGIYIPRFRNLNRATARWDYVRGFGYQGGAFRPNWRNQIDSLPGLGREYKKRLLEPGPWVLGLFAFGETLPSFENHITLDAHRKDEWGLPLIRIQFKFSQNETTMLGDATDSGMEMLEVTGFKRVNSYHTGPLPGGSAVHEMGTARMGRDPRTSVLNAFNQMHDVRNVFITDGSCMTSSGSQNPSLTYMALTARACQYAVEELKRGNL
jgi:choline dehydrogenase-like flavoprotein